MSDFLVPIDGLMITEPWQLGPVRLLDPSSARELISAHPGAANQHPLSTADIPKFADSLEVASAHVSAASIEDATDIISTALDILRVFQQSRTRWKTTMFGLAGDMLSARLSYLEIGDGGGVGLYHRGQLAGWTFQADVHEDFLASPGFTFAASAIGKKTKSEGEHRAILGLQLASQAVLEHRPPMQLLYSMISAEALLLERKPTPQTFRLARRSVFFLCGQYGMGLCGRQRPTCPFLATRPDERRAIEELKKLRERGKEDGRWRCAEWHNVLTWYDDRSDLVHGDDLKAPEQPGRVLFWLLTRLIPEALQWFADHPEKPLVDLDTAINRLPSPPDWEQIVGNQA